MAERKKPQAKSKNGKPAKPVAKRGRPRKGQPVASGPAPEQPMHH